MICSNCGRTVPDNFAFCAYCGRKLDDTSVKETLAAAAATTAILAETAVTTDGSASAEMTTVPDEAAASAEVTTMPDEPAAAVETDDPASEQAEVAAPAKTATTADAPVTAAAAAAVPAATATTATATATIAAEPVPATATKTATSPTAPTLKTAANPRSTATARTTATATAVHTVPRTPAGVKFVKAVLSVLLGILLYAFAMAFIALLIIRPGNIPEMAAKVDLSQIAEDSGLSNAIANEVNNLSLYPGQIDSDDISDFLRRESVAMEIGEAAARYAEAIASGDVRYHISSKEIIELLENIAPDIRDEFGYELTSDDYEEIDNLLDENVNLDDYSVENVLDYGNDARMVSYTFFTRYPLIALGILCVLLVFDALLLHRKNIAAFFMNAGAPAVLVGLSCICLSLMFGSFSGFNNLDSYGLAAGLTAPLMGVGLICLESGIVFLVIFFIIMMIRSKRPPRTAVRGGSKAWRITGLITNVIGLSSCAALIFLHMRGMF